MFVFPHRQIWFQLFQAVGVSMALETTVRACYCGHSTAVLWLWHFKLALDPLLLLSSSPNMKFWWLYVWSRCPYPVMFTRNRKDHRFICCHIKWFSEEFTNKVLWKPLGLVNCWNCMVAWYATQVPFSATTCMIIQVHRVCLLPAGHLP